MNQARNSIKNQHLRSINEARKETHYADRTFWLTSAQHSPR